ncbi:FAD-dependent oxidoreductase [Sneathiella sp. P13V-1]|uniref:NAD(P)/FAD-dependent oxidoreductase n=1 Tax=Sneathiella sp. P13V-1 TaxID=2697366 RepID=UPI00187B7369|nr:FAD-dependent oxidoreductase [Sneathiella sp. P13V-1]MBE7636616.1 FAD-dependent oxidoreductase [Sneathiella sp. P13V-1]
MKSIAVIGTGISGLSAAWLLSKSHRVTVYEKQDRLGGHSNTVEVDGHAIDTGFIVFNNKNYPNLVGLFDELKIRSLKTEMSFSVSMNNGSWEYGGSGLAALFAQKRNLLRPSFIKMLLDIKKFYEEAPNLQFDFLGRNLTLGEYLKQGGYSDAFIRKHLLPMGAAIWSTPANDMLDYPAETFVRFCDNHGLLQIADRPEWRTVSGGSRTYVNKIAEQISGDIRLNSVVTNISTTREGVFVECRNGHIDRFDDVVIATHADQALSFLKEPAPEYTKLLGAFPYEKNLAVLHTDETLLPKRKKTWSSWNYLSQEGKTGEEQKLCVSYWMNKLQHIQSEKNYIVTLNPISPPKEGTILRSFPYEHPIFDSQSIAAQKMLWNLQGKNNLWFCGSYFGYGFHEDGIQSGLAVAEAIGGAQRPWNFSLRKSRISLPEYGKNNQKERVD